LEVVDVASGRRTTVYETHEGLIEYPRWSPDDTRLAFETLTVGASASWLSTVTVGDGPGTARPITEKSLMATYPDWRRAGDLIVFTTYDLGEFQQTDEPSNLYTIHPDGSGMRQLTHYGHGQERATQPTWTPDGARILFTLVGQDPGRFDGPRHAAFIDPDGTGLRVLDPDATHPRVRPTA
jgi:Tol biopolymer transport system component